MHSKVELMYGQTKVEIMASDEVFDKAFQINFNSSKARKINLRFVVMGSSGYRLYPLDDRLDLGRAL